MRLLLDEMFSGLIAQQLRQGGHDVQSLHDDAWQHLEGQADVEAFHAAAAAGRAIVTENVRDYLRLASDAAASGQPSAQLVLTTDRQFPRGDPRTLGKLVLALERLLLGADTNAPWVFLSSD